MGYSNLDCVDLGRDPATGLYLMLVVCNLYGLDTFEDCFWGDVVGFIIVSLEGLRDWRWLP